MTSDNFGGAYTLGFKRTVRFLAAKGIPYHEAEETAQAAWAWGWERVSQLRDEASILTWVNTIALNKYRRIARSPGSVELLPEHGGVSRIDTTGMDLRHLLTRCRPCEQSILEHHMHGITAAEHGRELGITATAVRIRLVRARRAVRAQVDQRAVRKAC